MEDLQKACEQLKEALDSHQAVNQNFPNDFENKNIQGIMDYAKKDYAEVSNLLVASAAIDVYEPDTFKSEEEENPQIAYTKFRECVSELIVGENAPVEDNFLPLVHCKYYMKLAEKVTVTEKLKADEDYKQYERAKIVYEHCRTNLLKRANKVIEIVRNDLVKIEGDASNATSTAEVAIERARSVKTILYGEDGNGGLKKKAEDWQNAINEIEDEKQRANMQENYDTYKALIESENGQDASWSTIENLISKLDNNIKFYGKVLETLPLVTYCGNSVAQDGWNAESCIKDAKPYAMGLQLGSAFVYIDTHTEKGKELNDDEMQIPQFDSTYSKNNLADDAFYNKINEICKKPPENDEKSAESKQNMNDRLSQGTEAQLTLSSEPSEPLNNADWEQWGDQLPSIYLNQQATSSADIGNVSSDAANRKEISKSSRESMNSTMDIWSGIGNLVTNNLENLYIVEYDMQMFSTYTTGKVEGEAAETLSGVPISEENNELYRSEVEYILWGDKNAASNVMYTTASIFGVRFLINSIYAFTDAEINTETLTAATAIAGWTGFGIPLVQNVIKLALALAESGYDCNELLSGKEVVFWKTKESWTMSLTGAVTPSNDSDNKKRIAFSYNDYIRVLMLASMSTGHEKEVLARTADCIQMNVARQGSSTRLCQAYTMGAISADLKVNTIFLNRVPRFVSVSTQFEEQIPFSYKSVLGY